MLKLKHLKNKLKEWNKNTFGDVGQKMRAILQDTSQLDKVEVGEQCDEEMKLRRNLHKKELDSLLLVEHRMAFRKFKVKWLNEGDRNTKFFHKILSARRNKNFISMMEKEWGGFTEREDEIIEEVNNYVKKLYHKER